MEIQYKSKMPLRNLPIIIIGAGGIVRDAHLPAYQKAGFQVYGIFDIIKSKAQSLADTYHIPRVFDSLSDAINAAPTDTVFDLALMPGQFASTLEQLPDHAAVLLQKPMGDYSEQTGEIWRIAQRKSLKAAVNCQLRFAPFINAARDLINRGLIGDLYDMEVRLTAYTPWEIFPDIMNHPRLEIQMHSIHYIDLIRSFLGEPQGVQCKTVKHPAKKYASSRSTILFDYGDNLHAVINTNHDHQFGPRNQESFIKWEGTKGAIKVKMGLLLNYPRGVADEFEYCILSESGIPEWQTVQLEGSWFPDAFIGSMAALMRYAAGETGELSIGVDDVIKTMAVIDAAYKANAQGGFAPTTAVFQKQ